MGNLTSRLKINQTNETILRDLIEVIIIEKIVSVDVQVIPCLTGWEHWGKGILPC